MKTLFKITIGLLLTIPLFCSASLINPSDPPVLASTTTWPIYPPSIGSLSLTVSQSNIQSTICDPSWVSAQNPNQSYTDSQKSGQLSSFGYTDQTLADYQENHIIPIELGGNATDPNNLWPEYKASTDSHGDAIGSMQKNQTENWLRDNVCSGTSTLADAQSAMTTDWVQLYYLHIYGTNESTSTYDH